MEKLTNKTFKNFGQYLKLNIANIVIIISMYLILAILSKLPYVGLLINNVFIIIILWIFAIILLKIPARITALFSIFFLIITVILLNVGLYDNAVLISELVFLFLLIGFFQDFFVSFNENKQR